MGKVLVLGSDTRSFLAVIRSLGRQGLEVHVGWCPAHAPALASRYVARVHQIPAYTSDGDDWKQALVSLLRQERFDLVIPCDDPTTIPLQHHRADLEPYGRIYLLDDHAFRVTGDKIKSYELAVSLGVQVPHAVVVSTPAEAQHALDRLSLPLVVKPASTLTVDDLGTAAPSAGPRPPSNSSPTSRPHARAARCSCRNTSPASARAWNCWPIRAACW